MKGKIPTGGWRRRGSSTLEYVIVIAAGALLAGLLYAAVSSDDIADLLREKVMQALNGALVGGGKEIVKGNPENGDLPAGGSPQPGIPPGVEPGGGSGAPPGVSGGGSAGTQGETAPEEPPANPKPPARPPAPPPAPKEEENIFLKGLKTVGNVALDFIGYHDAKAALTGVDENGNKIGWGERILRGAMVLPIAKPVKGVKMVAKYGDDALRFAKGKVDDLARRVKKTVCACPRKAGNNLENQTRAQLLKSKASYERLIKEHKEKLEAYKKNPDAYDNQGLLKNAPSPEIREKIIQGRIKQLEKQIKKQQGELDKINRLLKERE